MKIVEPSATLISPTSLYEGEGMLVKIEQMGRISHRSESMQEQDSWKKFIKTHVIEHGDWSITEHASATVIFRVDRGITHELVRHRLFSFTQESTRFVRYGGKMVSELEFVLPENIPHVIEGVAPTKQPYGIFHSFCESVEKTYSELLDAKVRPQEARSVLPNALASTISMTGNLRSWRWFFLARTTQESHPDMRRVTIPLLKQFQERIQFLYDDIEPLQKQSVSMAKIH